LSSPSEALLQLRGARKTYWMGENAIHALDGVDLDIHAGEFAAIIGSSGSGKSTLMHMLGCLDRLSEGSYTLGGEDMSVADDTQLSRIRNREIGFVFQQFHLLPNLSVQENIALPLAYSGIPRKERLERAKIMAGRVGLDARLDHRPTELSGGQCQRVAIARALIHNPRILFADEPTGALDSKTGLEILALLDQLHAEGLTILLVTHDPKVAHHAHRNITLSDGQILKDETRVPRPQSLPAREDQTHPNGHLQFGDMFRIGLREGLLAHKLRTALTLLGVIIGVASVIAMSSFSLGSKKKQADQIRALGANLVRVVDRRLEGASLYEARASGSLGLSRQDAAALRSRVPDIQRSALQRALELEVELNRRPQAEAQVLAVAGDWLEVNNLRLEQGRSISAEDQQLKNRVAVLGAGLKPKDTESLDLRIGGQPYQVIGWLENRFVDTTELEAADSSNGNYSIYLPLETALNRYTWLPLRSELDEIQLQLRDEDQLAPAGRSIRRILDTLHRGVEDFDLVIPLDLLKSKQESQKLLDLLSLAISAISLLVGGIGIMNIMLASVTERLKEIGIRRAVGARKPDIRRQFLVEAILISMCGGLAGIGLSIGIVSLASIPLAIPVVFSPGVILVAFAAAFGTGLGFGAYPAIRASNQNLVDILSRE